ncbi:ATP-binding protein [Argonema galeatum]|uniref:ATP-binding protein n=1 Tax=Argonema galeatum TaxID=2942762 RepID=UPI00201158FA|nr:ATP-binding protein [Argonema galeatum]MCL1465204.1 response regulator [Argonema galeatum A003/A1]
MPHGNCYLWETPLVWLHVLSDLFIAIAYFSIPAMLIYFIYKRNEIPFLGVFGLFGAFIILCGTGHLLEIWTLWHPAYWVSGLEKALTALVSCYTAVEMGVLLPQFLALKTPEQLEVVNRELQNQIVERERAEEVLHNIVVATASVTGEKFFPAVVRHLAEALGVRYAFIAEIVSEEPDKLQTLAFWADDNLETNFEYNLPGTPCETVIEQGKQCYYPSGVQELFPEAKGLAVMGVTCYLGVPVLDSSRQAIGILCVNHDKPLSDVESAKAIMKIFAARAGAEIQRQWAQESLRLAYDGLEVRVRERTAELSETLHTLEAEIVERKKVELALEQERQQLRQIITNAPVAMAMFDTEMRYLAYSDRWLKDYDLDGLDLIGLKHHEILPQISKQTKAIYSRALQGEVISLAEDAIEREDGTKLYLRWAVQPWCIQTPDLGDTNQQPNNLESQIFNPKCQVGGIIIVTQMINELVEAREAALEAARMKSVFLANMSHEIRTPMNGVLGMTDLLLKTTLTNHQQEFMQTIKISAETLLALINDILDFSKLEAGKMRLQMRVFDLNTSIGQVFNMVQVQANAKGIRLLTSIDANVPQQLIGDPHRLHQILVNLVENSIKFTDKGEVTIAVRIHKETPFVTSYNTKKILNSEFRILFSVRDTGIGIAPENQKKLFQSFSQVDGSTTRAYGGSGLGLAICKQLVELMEGEIGVESEVGKGSVFWFTVPLQKSQVLAVMGNKSSAIGNREEANQSDRLWWDTPDSPIINDPLLTSNLKILLVEDMPINQKVVLNQLKILGYQADCATNGQAALELMTNTSYDLVLMDCQMPVLDGYETTKRIRVRECQDRHTIVIALTAHAMSGDREKCLAAGMDDYITKPISTKQLSEVIERWIQTKDESTKILDNLQQDINTESQPPADNSMNLESQIQSPTEEIVDRVRLYEIARGDAEFQLELLQAFMEDAPTYLKEAKEALLSGDCNTLGRRAHQLKGGSATVAIRFMPDLAARLQSQAEANQLDGASEIIAELEKILERINTFIANW